MGIQSSHQELVIATVNYSGILLSPFEFYSEDYHKQEEAISKCFRTLLSEKILNFDAKTFKWGLGKIDQKIQKQRYTPIYNANVGIENDKLVNEQNFRAKWKQHFVASKSKVDATNEEIQNTQNFDLHCYRSIIAYIYNEKDLSKAPSLNPSKYVNFMKKMFSKSFLNEDKKIDLTLKAMQSENVDVFFFQQVNTQFLNVLKKNEDFQIIQNQKSNSIVVLRRKKFKKIHDTAKTISWLPENIRLSLNWNQDTTVCLADQFIFISIHLSSKKQKNGPQVKNLLQIIQKLTQIYPMCQIVIGGDANSFISPTLISKKYHSFPDNEKQITTMKKRTWVQPQVNKADELAAQVKDVLISTLPFSKPRVVSIKGVDSSKIMYLPNQDHPCDHFVVASNIVVRD